MPTNIMQTEDRMGDALRLQGKCEDQLEFNLNPDGRLVAKAINADGMHRSFVEKGMNYKAVSQFVRKVIDCKAEAVLETFWADNTFMQAENVGVGYRRSKDLDNRDSELAPWGCPVVGIDCQDGWLAVEHRFLPIYIRGVQVLFRERGQAATKKIAEEVIEGKAEAET